jgi:hypothetical protein
VCVRWTKDRRFIPLRLDDAPIQGSLAQFVYNNWLGENFDQEFPKILAARRPPAKPTDAEAHAVYAAKWLGKGF